MKRNRGFIVCLAIGVFGLLSSLRGSNTGEDSFSALLQMYMSIFFIAILIAGIFMLVLYIRNRGLEESSIHKIRETYLNHAIFSGIFVLVLILLVLSVYFSLITGDTQQMGSKLITTAFLGYFLVRQLQRGKQLRKELREAESNMRAYGYTRRPE